MDTHDTDDQAEAASSVEGVENDSVQCTCRWQTMDTGNAFYARRVEADPGCKVHPD